MDVTELLLVIQQSHQATLTPPEGMPRTVQTNIEGKIEDQLSVIASAGVPDSFHSLLDQQWTVTGFTFGQHQILEFFQEFARVAYSKLAR
jgi:hypothetical protein